MTDAEMLTDGQAAERLGITAVELYRRIDAGEIAAAKNERGRIVVRATDIERLAGT